MLQIYSTEAARSLDRRAVTELGIPSEQLMARAGMAAARLIMQRWPLAQTIEILCGAGNNGGDGYVVALHLHQSVRQVLVHAWGEPDAQRCPDAYAARQNYLAAGGVVLDARQDPELAGARFERADLIIDGLFGLGGKPLSGALVRYVSKLNALEKPVFALDSPSGLDCETGASELAVKACVTVSFIVPKLGLYTGAARAYVGELIIDDLQLPATFLRSEIPIATALTEIPFARQRRSAVAHKGSFGHVYAIGGSPGFGGAILLCAQAALRTGAGLVSVISDPDHALALLIARPELMVYREQALPKVKPGTVLAIGPGLNPTSALAQQFFEQSLQWSGPKVLDADALNLLAQLPLAQQKLGPAAVITPHPGEAARLLQTTVAVIEADRAAAVRALANRFECVAVLKGAGTLIATPTTEAIRVCQWGNPGMASGGMGDVLTGVIAALMAQGLAAQDAAEQGVALHAKAADVAAKSGERGMLASDVLAQLRRQINALAAKC